MTLLAIDLRVALVSLALVPAFAASLLALQTTIRTLAQRQKEQAAVISAALQESVSNLRPIKLFLLSPNECLRYLRNMRLELDLLTRAFNCDYVVSTCSSFFAAAAPLLLVWVGGHEIIAHRMTVGQLVASSALLSFLYGPTTTIVGSNVAILKALVSLDRVFEILDAPAEGAELDLTTAVTAPSGFSIEFRDVSFKYDGGSEVLKDVSLVVSEGEALGIVGPIGVGKSTLLGLVTRFYDPSAGAVLIGGVDIRRLRVNDLRHYLSVVSQTPFMTSGSVSENIRLGRPQATQAEIAEAIERAKAATLIDSLPHGLDTEVGEGGSRLSRGQRQLIALARVILRGSPILLLDEPTSSVDPTTEALMREALREYSRGRTTIVVCHRLPTVLDVNRVLVLEAPTALDVGSHEELMERSRFYRQIASAGRFEPVQRPPLFDSARSA